MALEFTMRMRAMGIRVNHEKKSDGVTVHQERERWGESSPSEKGMALEFTIRKRAMGCEVTMRKRPIG